MNQSIAAYGRIVLVAWLALPVLTSFATIESPSLEPETTALQEGQEDFRLYLGSNTLYRKLSRSSITQEPVRDVILGTTVLGTANIETSIRPRLVSNQIGRAHV